MRLLKRGSTVRCPWVHPDCLGMRLLKSSLIPRLYAASGNETNKKGLHCTLSLGPPGLSASCNAKEKKQRTDPSHSSEENPPNNWSRNFTISERCLGGVSAFGPSLRSFSAAWASDSPYTKHDSSHKQVNNNNKQVNNKDKQKQMQELLVHQWFWAELHVSTYLLTTLVLQWCLTLCAH